MRRPAGVLGCVGGCRRGVRCRGAVGAVAGRGACLQDRHALPAVGRAAGRRGCSAAGPAVQRGAPAAGAWISSRCLGVGAAVDCGERWRCMGAGGPWWWSVRCPAWAGPHAVHSAGAVAVPLRRLPGLLAALPGVVRGRDRGGGRSCRCGVLFLFGSLPQVHSRVSGRLAGVFPALTRRGLVPLPQKPIKRATSKNPAKNKKHSTKISKQ